MDFNPSKTIQISKFTKKQISRLTVSRERQKPMTLPVGTTYIFFLFIQTKEHNILFIKVMPIFPFL
ncbi:hypothetical protein B0A64_18740 [Flavobacterium araucananum]|uniref:Uncharacterized protein n=1 Tax=Flavobacterium araucananum TaxID=946678 RepID=A0A227NZQ1_9FLAO|nr:hypothetical protein B0A64_18740 [Flavobacterium araucananum]